MTSLVRGKNYYCDDHIVIHHGDCRDWDGEVGAIITDPPYGRDALPLWSVLANVAARSLRPGGWLLAYSGQACLPEVMAALTIPELAYRWTLSTHYAGSEQLASIGDMAVLTGWKPVLAYRRRPFDSPRSSDGKFVSGARFQFSDVLRRGGREKDAHDWAQPISEAVQLVQRFSEGDDLILDPFMGSGTVLRAAKDLGRRAVGIELDEQHCQTAVRRLGQEVFDLGAAA